MKVLVIGNGPSAARGGFGARIDSDEFDQVVRFNEARTKGYEEHLGTRTDVLVITNTVKPRIKADVMCLSCPKPGVKDPRCKQTIPRRAWRAAGKDVYGASGPKGRWVSSGMAYIHWRLLLGDDVVIHGFDGLSSSPIHYFPGNASTGPHSPELETKALRSLVADGRVALLAAGEGDWYQQLYDAVYRAGYHADPNFTHSVPLVRWFANRYSGLRVLDIGASKGAAVRLLNRAGFRAEGVEVSQIACDEARRLGATVTRASATDLPFDDNDFDLSLHTDVFEHLKPEDTRRAVAESVRVTKFIVGCTICTRRDFDRRHIELAGIAHLSDHFHHTVEPLDWWKDLYREEGCTIIDTTTRDTFLAVLPGVQIGAFHPPAGDVHRDAEEIVDALCRKLSPSSVLDIGCNTGHFLKQFRARGVHDVLGVDWLNMLHGLQVPPECFRVHDLRKPLRLGRTYDLVLCLEVAEHLPPESADTLIETISANGGRFLAFGAAIPNQGGTGHLNEQPVEYWTRKLEAQGYDVTLGLGAEFPPSISWWYRQNTIYAERS